MPEKTTQKEHGKKTAPPSEKEVQPEVVIQIQRERRSLQTAPTLTVRPHRNDGSQEDAKQEQPADEGLLSYTKKLCLFFKKHPPGELHNQKML